MKVTSTQYNLTQAVNNTANTKSANAESATTQRAQATTPVDPVLGEAQGQLAAMPEVDMDRVNAMKDAISAGKIDINLDELTLAIEKYYKG
ncbi:MAG: flagellar biosynthesis anti-sigma factor FlgM [Hafnia sp.]